MFCSIHDIMSNNVIFGMISFEIIIYIELVFLYFSFLTGLQLEVFGKFAVATKQTCLKCFGILGGLVVRCVWSKLYFAFSCDVGSLTCIVDDSIPTFSQLFLKCETTNARSRTDSIKLCHRILGLWKILHKPMYFFLDGINLKSSMKASQ